MPVKLGQLKNFFTRAQPQNRWIWGAVGIAILGLGVLLFLQIQRLKPIQGMVTFTRPARGHDNDLVIEAGDLPPAGGPHHDRWQNCGIYTEPIKAENAVHSLEHGVVWLTYQTDLSPEEIATLQELVRGQTYLLLSPYPGQRSPLVLTAWGVQLELNSVQDRRVQEFIDRYRIGPTTPERGASCTGGIGDPIP